LSLFKSKIVAWNTKAKNYIDYANPVRSKRDFGFRVLVITKTEKRLLNLKSTIKELINRIFYFTDRDDVCHGYILRHAGQHGFLRVDMRYCLPVLPSIQ
jgi:hypothetical protein